MAKRKKGRIEKFVEKIFRPYPVGSKDKGVTWRGAASNIKSMEKKRQSALKKAIGG